MMDRLRYLSDTYNNAAGARWLAARPHNFTAPPGRSRALLRNAADPGARRLAPTGNYSQAYNIARQSRRRLAAGRGRQPASRYGVRDEYTSLTWLAGDAAMSGLNRPADAVAHVRPLFDAAAARCRSPPRAFTGPGARRCYAGRAAEANGLFPARPRPIPNCSTASWRSSGSAGRCPRRRPADHAGDRRPARGLPAEAAGPRHPPARPAGPPRRADPVRPRAAESLDSDAERVLAAELATSRSAGRTWPCGPPAPPATTATPSTSARPSRPISPACPAGACGR